MINFIAYWTEISAFYDRENSMDLLCKQVPTSTVDLEVGPTSYIMGTTGIHHLLCNKSNKKEMFIYVQENP